MPAPVQVPIGTLPLEGMAPHAVLHLREAEIAPRLGVEFEDGEDGLDVFRGAGLDVSGERAAILVHNGNPGGCAQVYLTDGPGYVQGADGWEADARHRVDGVLDALGIAEVDVWWRRGEAHPAMETLRA